MRGTQRGRMIRPVVRAAVAIGALLAAGCQRTQIEAPLDTVITDTTPAGDMEFWHTLPGRSAVSNSEGLRGVLLFAEGTDSTKTYEERLALLRERGWVVESFDEPGTVAMQRGTLAKALCHAMDIRGGVMMHMTDRSPRYAIRELQYLSVIPPSTENQVISGLDFVGVISKAQDFMMEREARRMQKESGAPEGTPAESPAAESPPAESPPAESAGETETTGPM